MKLNRKLRPKIVRGLLSLFVVMGICAMLFPMPMASLPSNLPEKDSSEPFPCQNRPCGCRSAEQCWKKCCCFSDTQKVAWAKANKVKVPEFVLAAAKLEVRRSSEICSLTGSGPKSALKNPGGCSHCKKNAVTVAMSSRCDKSQTTSAKSHIPESHSPIAEKPREFRKPSASSKWVMAVYAAECQGQGPPAFCFPISIVPDRPALVTPSVAVVEIMLFESERLRLTSLRPPLPPPKIG